MRRGVKRTSRKRMAKGGGIRRMAHGGSHCGPGMMYQNGGCVSMAVGGRAPVAGRASAGRTPAGRTRARAGSSGRGKRTSSTGRNTRMTRQVNNRINRMNGMNNNSCPPGQHMMPNGSCMQGAYHGASTGRTMMSITSYRKGGNVRGGKFAGRSQNDPRGGMKK
tara:strand:+ start:1785 stop:2276 length:492 start_codon:yes stop_codon:yes gene_type:complete